MSVIHKILFAFIEVLAISFTMQANNWQKQYMADEFGDPDYSNPCFVSHFEPQGGYGASVNVVFANGVFCMELRDAYESLSEFRGLKIKAPSGNVYEIGTYESDGILVIDEDYAPMFLELLDTGNFTMSIKTVKPFSDQLSNHTFRVGKQTIGIRDILFDAGWMFPPMHDEL